MKITIPELCLVVLIGPSGSGKSSFARANFRPTEVISSDFCRGLISDDENNQECTEDAFELVHFIIRKRLRAGKLTVMDATNVHPEDRKKLVELARESDCLAAAIVFDVPEKLCYERNEKRLDRAFGDHVIRKQHSAMRRNMRNLDREGFRYVYRFLSEREVSEAEIERGRLWNDRKDEGGPFDIIGDVHGCFDELRDLLLKLGYQDTAGSGYGFSHPEQRRVIFVGDLVDRGPKTPEVLRLVMKMVGDDTAICVPGNHDVKLVKKLKGRDVRVTHGLKESLDQLESESPEFKQEIVSFIDKLVSHYVFDNGRLVVSHAGMKENFQGRSSSRVRDFALYGETTGETDEYGLPVRYNWAQDYRGRAMVVYGHTPVFEPQWVNKTICIDTGCVFGGSLTALQYPEKSLVSVQAARTYYEPAKPFLPEDGQSQISLEKRVENDILDISDVTGRRVISTSFQRNITIREENAAAALEVMSRFAVNANWLIYLPPTMSPCETSRAEGLLEHPTEAFRYYLDAGVPTVVCEQKHMGSRAIVIICRSEEEAQKRFGVSDEGFGTCYTRTGRRFFRDLKTEQEFLLTIHDAVTKANWWNEFDTNWIALDCELMPWSAKAQELLRDQYAAVGASATASLRAAERVLEKGAERNPELMAMRDRYSDRLQMIKQYQNAYGKYCWNVDSVRDLQLAPFHLLATERSTYFNKDHQWHMQKLGVLAEHGNGLIISTPYKIIDLTDPIRTKDGIDWWFELTAAGGEGLVVKPLQFIATNKRGIIQPAVKCRGIEYLRIIYGPEYTVEEHLSRLRQRGLSSKRSLAAREFALGVEALERFVRDEPLYRVHECVFGILALESEPVDPRL